MTKPRAVLVGPPGAGKSTIGRRLARELGVEFYDTDAAIEAAAGRSIAEIFTGDGEPAFREIEERIVREAVGTRSGVVALGGGAVLSARTRAALRGHTVVYLEIGIAEGLRRTGTNISRPLLAGADPAAKYRALMRRRQPLYRQVATIRMRTDGRSPGRVVNQLLTRLAAAEANRTEPERRRIPRRRSRTQNGAVVERQRRAHPGAGPQ